MSHFDSGSEDGQINDFISGGEADDGDADSLDIKPPQAQHREASRRRSAKDKKQFREHKRKDRDRERTMGYRDNPDKERLNEKRHRHMTSSGRESVRDMVCEIQRDRNDRHLHRNHEYQEQREMEYNNQHQRHKVHQQRDHKQRMEPPLPIVRDNRDRRKYIENHTNSIDAERALEDLRSRLLSKRNKYEKENARFNEDSEQQRYEQPGLSGGSRGSGIYDRHMHHSRSSSREHRSDVKRRENVIEVIDSPEHLVDYKIKEKKIFTAEDPEQAARRAKLLDTEREMAKRKEVARKELEARRELRKGRDDDESELSSETLEPDIKKEKKKRYVENEKEHYHHKKKMKKQLYDTSSVEEGQYDDNQTVEISDNNENEFSECSTGEEDIDDSEEDSELTDSGESVASTKENFPKNKKKRRELNEEKPINNIKETLPGSPLSIGDLSKSPQQKNRNSRSRSRSVSHSVHSDDSKSPNRSRSQSKSMSPEKDKYLGSGSRSRSKSTSHSPLLKNRPSITRKTDVDDIQMKSLDTEEENKNKDKPPSSILEDDAINDKIEKLPNYYPGIQGCRSVEEFQCLNRIEEGTYGVVYRAKDKRTNEIVALKRLKMEKEKEGFPITSLREINTLLKGQHPNIVTVREIVVGSNMDKIFIVMDYVEHDLKSLMETMKHKEQSFFPGEVKCLTQQLLRAVGHLHDNWILHRDLKTSNLLLSHKGILKVGDFGLAREYGSPLKAYTSLVVTLWYRAPELLLCTKEYSTPIDLWSVGCIFAEFLQMTAMFPGKSEIDQLNRIFKELGTPNEKIWPGYKDLPAVQNLLSQNSHFTEYPVSNLRRKFFNKTTEVGMSLLQGMLTYDPKQRLTAELALKHAYFKELPLPIDPSMFPTWPAKSELGARKALASSPKPPSGGSQFKQLGKDEINAPAKVPTNKNTGFVLNAGIDQRQLAMGPGFSLKF